jgi:hypothetical protein
LAPGLPGKRNPMRPPPTLRLSRDHRRRLLFGGLALVIALAGVAFRAEAASISLGWNAPTTNADGSTLADLAAYRIYLGTATPSCPSASFHTVPSPTTSPRSGDVVASRIVGLTAGTTYVARVTAVDTSGNESGCSGSVSGAAVPDFSVTPSAATSFGSLTVGSTVDRTFTVENTSPASINASVSVGAPFTIVSGGSVSVPAAATRTVTVRFAPTAAGSFAGNVSFTANGDVVSRAVSGSAVSASPPATSATLSVTKNGTGTGTVSSAPAGIACGSDCSESVTSGTSLTLTAAAASGSTFAGWAGACAGTAASCTVTVSGAASVTATFTRNPVTLSVTKNGTGTGTVSSAPAGIACGGDCSESVTPGTQLILTASAAPGSTFAGWGGACAGAATSCTVTVDTTTGVSAAFAAAAAPAAAPTISGLAPAGTTVGTGNMVLTVNGSGFTSASVVRWNRHSKATTFVSATQLQIQLYPSELNVVRSVPVDVVTSGPGAGTTATVGFVVSPAAGSPSASPSASPSSTPAAVPVVSSLSPAGTTVGTGNMVLTVNGSGFTSASVVRWNGHNKATTFVSATQLQIRLYPSELYVVRSVPVNVVTPAPGGGISTAIGFVVGPVGSSPSSASSTPAAVPVVGSLSPASTTVGTGNMVLTVNGSGFTSASVVRWNGHGKATTFVSATQLRIQLYPSELNVVRSVPVHVVTPAPGGGASNVQAFPVTAP